MRSLIITLLAVFTVSSLTIAQDTYAQEKKNKGNFDGFYVGLDGGIEDSGTAYGAATAGWRKQTDGWLVYGLEAQYGQFDSQIETETWAAMLTAGAVLGKSKKHLLYLGAGYDNFEGFDGVRVSLGYEYAVTKSISLRLQSSGSFYDPGELNIYSAGVLFKF